MGINVLWPSLMILSFVVLPVSGGELHDHDRARTALEAGEILPLSTVLKAIQEETPGQVMAVELERKNGQWIYEIKILRAGGTLVKHLVNAKDGASLSRRSSGIEPNR